MLTYVAGFQANTQNYSDQLHATDEEMLKVAGALEETRAKLLEARAAEVKAKKELQDQLRVLEETATTRTKLTEELAEEKAKTAQAVTNLANATALATTARLKLEEELAEEKAKTAQALTKRDDIATIKLKLEEELDKKCYENEEMNTLLNERLLLIQKSDDDAVKLQVRQ